MTNDSPDFRRMIAESLFGRDAEQLLAENSEATVDLFETFGVRQLEENLQLPIGFFEALVQEDDWSFIIKLHALMEAAVTHLVVETIAKPSLQDIFARIDMSNTQTGKLAFADKLELLSKDVRRFVRTLSELRNEFVHDVSNVNVDLIAFIRGLPIERQKGFGKAFGWGFPNRVPRLEVEPGLYDPRELMKVFAYAVFPHAPRLSIWFGAMLCLHEVSRGVSLARLNAEQQLVVDAIITRAEALLEPQPTDGKTRHYALRGEPVSYVNPFDSVSEDDWNSAS
ncbi:hypothetical protein GBA65_13445 [Rubrobacter marinus]|uniref:Uncharacterized protein n=1 Tax=Rubrobacter marinus TaxID=2653852 RepID=A0A6G8PYP9_9ACTN|nr:hypothetical protein [Rubrobacter marinus]QIN79349.1 hypothetical protein GBA65_13445 [Rubrobacter marinus]